MAYFNKTGFLPIQHFLNLHPDLPEERQAYFRSFNINSSGKYLDPYTRIEAKNAEVLDSAELENLFDDFEKRTGRDFWEVNNPHDDWILEWELQQHLYKSTPVDYLWPYIGHRLPFTKKPGDNSLENLKDHLDFIILGLEDLQREGLKPVFDKDGQTILGYQFDEEKGEEFWVQQLQGVFEFQLWKGSFSIGDTFSSSSHKFRYILPQRENGYPLFERFRHAFAKTNEEMGPGATYRSYRVPREGWKNPSADKILESMIAFLKRLKENLNDEPSLSDEIPELQFTPSYPDPRTQDFIEGPVFDYFYSLSFPEDDIRRTKMAEKVSQAENQYWTREENETTSHGLEKLLEENGYSLIEIRTRHKQSVAFGDYNAIFVPVRKVGKTQYQFSIDKDGYATLYRGLPSPSRDLLQALYDDPDWSSSHHELDEILNLLPFGKESQIRYQNPNHPFHAIYEALPIPRRQKWLEVYDEFLDHLQDGLSVFGRMSDWYGEDILGEEELRYALHYALFKSQDPQVLFLILTDIYLNAPEREGNQYFKPEGGMKEILEATLDPILNHLYYFEEVTHEENSEANEVFVILTRRQVLSAWVSLSQISPEKLAERLKETLVNNPNAIEDALKSLYVLNDHYLTGEGVFYRVMRVKEKQPFSLIKRQKITETSSSKKGIPVRAISRTRPKWQSLEKELFRADTNYDSLLSLEEFLKADFSQPVESFLARFLKNHPSLTGSWEAFAEQDKSTALLAEHEMAFDMKTTLTQTRPRFFPEHRNLPLLPNRSLKKMIKETDDLLTREALWITYTHKDPKGAKILWLEAIEAWQEQKPFYGREVDFVDLLTPVEYLGGSQDEKLRGPLELLLNAFPENQAVNNALWSLSNETIPSGHLRYTYYELKQKFSLEPFELQNAATRAFWMNLTLFKLKELKFTNHALTPEDIRPILEELEFLEDWEKNFLLISVFPEHYKDNTGLITTTFSQVISIAHDLYEQTEKNHIGFPIGELEENLQALARTLEEIGGTTEQKTNRVWQHLVIHFIEGLTPTLKEIWENNPKDEATNSLAEQACEYLRWIRNGLYQTPSVKQKSAQVLWSLRWHEKGSEALLELLRTNEYALSSILNAILINPSEEEQRDHLDWLATHFGEQEILELLLQQHPFRRYPEAYHILVATSFYLDRYDLTQEENLEAIFSAMLPKERESTLRRSGTLLVLASLPKHPEAALWFLEKLRPELSEEKFGKRELENYLTAFLFGVLDKESLPECLPVFEILENHPLLPRETSPYLALFFDPETILLSQLEELQTFYRDFVPEEVLDSDPSKFDADEISGWHGYKTRYEEKLFAWAKLCEFYLKLVEKGYISDEKKEGVKTWALSVRDTGQKGVYPYWYLTTLAAISGDQNAISEITGLYYDANQQEEVKSKLHTLEYNEQTITGLGLFHPDSGKTESSWEAFLRFVEDVLIFHDPESFFLGAKMPELSGSPELKPMVMVEGGFVDEKVPGAENVIREPLSQNPETIPQNDDHARMVFQVLTGNMAGRDQEPDGMVINVALDYTKDFWPQLSEMLAFVWEEKQRDNAFSVINFSAGIEPGVVTKKIFDDLDENQDFRTCQTLIQELDKEGIIFVISAGNTPPANRREFLGTPLGTSNIFGYLGVPVLLVGSLRYDPEHPEEEDNYVISDFSSRGGGKAGPNIMTVGENWNVWKEEGEGFEKVAGTSFSAPFVARVIAQIRQINPKLKGSDIVRILTATAEDLGSHLPEDQGAGRMIAARCFFVSWLLNPGIKKPKKVQDMARLLGVEHEWRELRWVANRIRTERDFHASLEHEHGMWGHE